MRAQISSKMSVLLRSETAWGSTYDLFCGCDNDPRHLNLPPPMNQSLFRRLFACRRLLSSSPHPSAGHLSTSLAGHGNPHVAFHILAKTFKICGAKIFKIWFFRPWPGPAFTCITIFPIKICCDHGTPRPKNLILRDFNICF